MKVCHICKAVLSTPFNLRRHIQRKHGSEHEGYGKTSDGKETSYSNDDETSERSEESVSSGESSEDSECYEDIDDRAEDKNWVYTKFLDEIQHAHSDDSETFTDDMLQQLFIKRYGEYLIWHAHLKRHPVHKKIMSTISSYEYESGDYSKDEAIQLGIHQRRFLLQKVLKDLNSNASDDDDDEETTEC